MLRYKILIMFFKFWQDRPFSKMLSDVDDRVNLESSEIIFSHLKVLWLDIRVCKEACQCSVWMI